MTMEICKPKTIERNRYFICDFWLTIAQSATVSYVKISCHIDFTFKVNDLYICFTSEPSILSRCMLITCHSSGVNYSAFIRIAMYSSTKKNVEQFVMSLDILLRSSFVIRALILFDGYSIYNSQSTILCQIFAFDDKSLWLICIYTALRYFLA